MQWVVGGEVLVPDLRILSSELIDAIALGANMTRIWKRYD